MSFLLLASPAEKLGQYLMPVLMFVIVVGIFQMFRFADRRGIPLGCMMGLFLVLLTIVFFIGRYAFGWQ